MRWLDDVKEKKSEKSESEDDKDDLKSADPALAQPVNTVNDAGPSVDAPAVDGNEPAVDEPADVDAAGLDTLMDVLEGEAALLLAAIDEHQGAAAHQGAPAHQDDGGEYSPPRPLDAESAARAHDVAPQNQAAGLVSTPRWQGLDGSRVDPLVPPPSLDGSDPTEQPGPVVQPGGIHLPGSPSPISPPPPYITIDDDASTDEEHLYFSYHMAPAGWTPPYPPVPQPSPASRRALQAASLDATAPHATPTPEVAAPFPVPTPATYSLTGTPFEQCPAASPGPDLGYGALPATSTQATSTQVADLDTVRMPPPPKAAGKRANSRDGDHIMRGNQRVRRRVSDAFASWMSGKGGTPESSGSGDRSNSSTRSKGKGKSDSSRGSSGKGKGNSSKGSSSQGARSRSGRGNHGPQAPRLAVRWSRQRQRAISREARAAPPSADDEDARHAAEMRILQAAPPSADHDDAMHAAEMASLRGPPPAPIAAVSADQALATMRLQVASQSSADGGQHLDPATLAAPPQAVGHAVYSRNAATDARLGNDPPASLESVTRPANDRESAPGASVTAGRDARASSSLQRRPPASPWADMADIPFADIPITGVDPAPVQPTGRDPRSRAPPARNYRGEAGLGRYSELTEQEQVQVLASNSNPKQFFTNLLEGEPNTRLFHLCLALKTSDSRKERLAFNELAQRVHNLPRGASEFSVKSRDWIRDADGKVMGCPDAALPLHIVAMHGWRRSSIPPYQQQQFFQELCWKSADSLDTCKDSKNRAGVVTHWITPLGLCASKGNAFLARELLNQGAGILSSALLSGTLIYLSTYSAITRGFCEVQVL